MSWREKDWENLIERIRYKPNAVLSFRAAHGIPPWLSIDSVVPDRDDPQKSLRVTFEETLPLSEDVRIRSEAHAVAWIREVIAKWERHESDEWFRLDGKRFIEQHEAPLDVELDVEVSR